jgi:hypothetical protein
VSYSGNHYPPSWLSLGYNINMNDDMIDDFKQFITTAVSHQTSHFEDQFNKIEVGFEKIDQRFDKIHDLSDSISEALDNTNDADDSQLKDHERRLVNLEQKTA